ncbi:MerR family DNA-binding transcriptional regulator [Streptosporangium roseum]|uniref:MerR family DNA-binding transcriptional regulator n=1 Tax=Streptosporangium roseum TaxID=2001 RepID=UPI00332645F5
MTATAGLPATVAWPAGVTYLPSGKVAALLGVCPRAVAQYERDGLITASARTSGGHRRFALADVQEFLRQTRTAGRLTVGDIVSCRVWNDGRPVRILHVTSDGHRGVYVHWQDVSAHRYAMHELVGRSRLVRLLDHREHVGAA